MSEDSCIKVAVRIRPQIAREIIDSCRICTTVTPGEPQITLGTDKSFTYDNVFDMQHDQQSVYEQCAAPLVRGSLEGYNATILAYGQTGSGKTYTMGSGFDVEIDPDTVGIIPRAINQLFDGIKSITEEAILQGRPEPRFTIYAQFLELYNEDVIDLFDTTKDYALAKVKSGIRIHEDAKHSIYLSGVTSKAIHSAEEALQCLRQGALSRTTASTQMNAQSSRSHAIFTLHIEQKKIIKLEENVEFMETNGVCDSSDFETLTAKFHFVDLAGSERMKRTGATGDRAKEGISINCGLLALGNVISALGDKSKKVSHVPYRDSKLTRLLQDSLGGNSRTVMIACISPSDRDFMETLNTLMYANRARNIQNKVIVNQDKSSRTILMLRQEIQQLQMQLLEYKQGKRIINEDGTETVNDMYLENTMLQTDVANLRIRLKAMQETIDALNAKNTQLLTEKAAGVWLGGSTENADKSMTDMIQGYLKEVEELRAKLLESEYLCSQLRKQVNRHSMQGRNRTLSNSLTMHCDNEEENAIGCLLAVAKKDVEKNKEILSRTKSNVDHEDEFASDDDVSDSDSDSDGRDSDNNSEFSQELAELTSEINVKQKLIDELETAQKRLNSMRQHYEDKLQQLQTTIKQTQKERDTVLASYGGSHSNQPNDKMKKIKDEYETKISSLNKELKNLQSAKKEHARLLRSQTQYESQLKTLRVDVAEMKRAKVKLINKMKEEANKHHEQELKRNREIAQLRKESRRAENLIRSLETKNRVKDVVLKRKQEEVSALRKAARTSKMSSKAAGRPTDLVKSVTALGASPKVAKQKWQLLEKNISDNTFNRQSIVSLERELVRLMEKRKTLHSTLQTKTRKLTDLVVNRPRDNAQIVDLEDEIEQIRANLDYVNDSIKEVQQNIIEIEETKVQFESSELISDLGTPEIAYIVEKLYNMIVYYSSQAALKEANRKELEARLTEVEKERSVEQQLLRHMLEVRNNENELKSFDEVEPDRVSETESDSSRSNSPLPPPALPNDAFNTTFRVGQTPLPGDSTSKFRRRTAVPEELLFSQTNKPEVQEQQFFPVVSNHNVNNNVENNLSTNYNITKVPSASSVLKSFNKPELKSPQFPRKVYDRQESTSPKVSRKLFGNSNLIGKPGSMDRGLNKTTPPNSPPVYKKFNSRDENVFSRLTSSTIQPVDRYNGRGIISQYQGKTTMKSPLICTNIAEGHSRAVLALYATDDVLFSASKDKTVKVWDLHQGTEMATLGGHPNSVTSVQYDEKSWMAYTVSSAYIKVWDMRYNKCVKTLSSSGVINSNLNSISTQLPILESQITEIKLNYDGTLLYAATGDKVKIIDLRKHAMTGRLSGGHQAAVMCMAVGKLSNEEDLVITGSKDHYIKVFEVPSMGSGTFTNRVTLEPPHYDGVQTLALRDNILFSGSRDYVIKKWDIDSREIVTSINNAHKDWICGLTFVERQPILISVCRSGWLKLWYTDTCTLIGEMKAHDSAINSITTNSSHIFTAAHDNTVKIWRLSNRVDCVFSDNS